MKCTVLGASGFIGGALVQHLRQQGNEVLGISRLARTATLKALDADLAGHLFYCIGLTSDFRERPYETMEAHVGLLSDVLQQTDFEKLIYLSSTRVYSGASSTSEDASFQVNPHQLTDLYNISKLAGESLCMHSDRPTRIVRLSNVYGCGATSHNFLDQVLNEAKRGGKVCFQTAPESAKDYIAIEDTVHLLGKVGLHGVHQVYNLGHGYNISNREIADKLESFGVSVQFLPGGNCWEFPRIDTTRIDHEFPRARSDFFLDLEKMYAWPQK